MSSSTTTTPTTAYRGSASTSWATTPRAGPSCVREKTFTSVISSRRRRWRTTIVLATSVTVLGGITSAVPTVAFAAVVDTSASYALVNRNSGKALDVYERATADGARISQYTRNDETWQQWQFVDSGGGYYRLKSRHSGKVLDFPSTADRTGLVQTADAGRTGQQFRLADSDGGHVRLINRASGKAVDVLDFSTANLSVPEVVILPSGSS